MVRFSKTELQLLNEEHIFWRDKLARLVASSCENVKENKRLYAILGFYEIKIIPI